MERRGVSAERIDLHNTDRQEQARQIAERPELILDKVTGDESRVRSPRHRRRVEPLH
jgi:hypothetical protein